MPDFNEQLLLAGKKIYGLGLVRGRAGNISVRLAADRVLITACNSCLGEMTHDDLVVIDMNGHHLTGSKDPSSENLAHIEVYKYRSDISAIVHTHSTYATILAYQGRIPKRVNPEADEVLRGVTVIPEQPHGTKELAEAVASGLKDGRAILMERHGALTVGCDLEEAVEVAEVLEEVAKMTYLLDLKER